MQKKKKKVSILVLSLTLTLKSLSHVWLFATPRTVAYQAPLSMEFFRQEYWSGVPFTSPSIIISVQIIYIST